jgi:hypothetical protein
VRDRLARGLVSSDAGSATADRDGTAKPLNCPLEISAFGIVPGSPADPQ